MEIIDAPREVTSEWHILQAAAWLEYDKGRGLDNVLVYAAVELRAAIERTLFELLYLLKEHDISEADIRRSRSQKGLEALLREADASYRKTIEFTQLVASVTPGMPVVSVIDTAYLRRMWSKLSEYCHFQIEPDKTFNSENRQFQRRGFQLLKDVLDRFIEWRGKGNMGIIKRSSMPDLTRSIYDKFVGEGIDANQVKLRLKIIKPALHNKLYLL